ncbi:MAG: hypothetical protein IKG47_12400 [Oscillospiraceae bacterium]|nr:hypothetical protein [Oscillospiraceae bacterium]
MYWIREKSFTEDQILAFLCRQKTGICIIDGLSGSGKSRLITKLNGRRETEILPTSDFIERLIAALQTDGCRYENLKKQ